MTQNLTLLCATIASLVLGACSTLPPVTHKPERTAASPAATGRIAEVSSALRDRLEEDDSALLLVPAADEALRWRLALIDNATRSIDAQYFIWKDDASGSLMLEHLFDAADRGVAVRLLVDDMFLSTGGAFEGADAALAAIDYHPNIHLRLFNPGKYRSGIMGLAGNFGGSLKTYNRRMHNKLLVVDGHFAMVGGRNIGDEYFGLYAPYNFLDLDVLLSGPVVADTASAYDEYWNAELAYPAGSLMPVSEDDFRSVRRANRAYAESQADLLTAFAPEQNNWQRRFAALDRQMLSGFVAFLQDEPVQRGGHEYRLYSMLNDLTDTGGRDLIISTPYLIPVGSFLDDLREDVASGISVKVLTNSLASNDATAAHSHYKKYRGDLLATGSSLFEFDHQPGAALRGYADARPAQGEFIGLHLKASSIDGRQCFIGSMNMDPRAVELNTENGVYIESPALCDQLQRLLTVVLQPENAWRVTRDADGKLQWTGKKGTVYQQPAQGAGQRAADFFFRILPLESQM